MQDSPNNNGQIYQIIKQIIINCQFAKKINYKILKSYHRINFKL